MGIHRVTRSREYAGSSYETGRNLPAPGEGVKQAGSAAIAQDSAGHATRYREGGESERAGLPNPAPAAAHAACLPQAEPAYAPISMPSSMTSTSGLVHFIVASSAVAGGATTLRILIPHASAG